MKIYKYLPSKFLGSVVDEGHILFRPLSYFQNYEDAEIRGDPNDGRLIYKKEDGLDTNIQGKDLSLKIKSAFHSYPDSNNIFIFSLSKTLSPKLAAKFNSDVCIEFSDSNFLTSKIDTQIKKHSKIRPRWLLADDVTYYDESEAPNIDWALPDRIVYKKLRYFSYQDEYRICFSKEQALREGRTKQEFIDTKPVLPKTLSKDLIIKVGDLSSGIRIHKFT